MILEMRNVLISVFVSSAMSNTNRFLKIITNEQFAILCQGRLERWQTSLPNNLDDHALAPVAVEFAVENLFPRAETQLAFCNDHDDFETHHLPL
jgi:hypothetical protein